MAEVIYPAVVTDKQIKINNFKTIEVYVRLLTDNPSVKLINRVLDTDIPSEDGRNKCEITVDSQASIIINPGSPSKIEAPACRSCRFTTVRGAQPPLICRIYRYNKTVKFPWE